MALPIGGKILLVTNVLIDFLRAGMHAEWVLSGHGTVVRFISAVALLELRLGADTPKRKKPWTDSSRHSNPDASSA